MARNSEKAQALLNRFITMKRNEFQAPRESRPAFAHECRSLPEAERWRYEVVQEISKKVSTIQDASLGEHRIRDLNDEINKLIRIKKHWERQIKALGGPDYMLTASRMDGAGRAIAVGNYFYFGAARELPGVRELLEKHVEKGGHKKTRRDLQQLVNAEYFGFQDDNDERLERLEQREEARILAEARAATYRPHRQHKCTQTPH